MTDCTIECYGDNDRKVAMLMPYIPHTLSKVIHNGYGLTFPRYRVGSIQLLPLSFVAHFSVQVARALAHMHGLNMVHRDLTPCNVLLTHDLTVKVADMGLSRQSSKWMSPMLVTEAYRAPELFTGSESSEYTCAIDMWSLGILIADAMEGTVVFSSRRSKDMTMSTFRIIAKTLCPKDHPLAKCLPEDFVAGWDPDSIMPNAMDCKPVKLIVLRLMAFDANERLLAHQLLQDTEWLETAYMTEKDKEMVRVQIARADLLEEIIKQKREIP